VSGLCMGGQLCVLGSSGNAVLLVSHALHLDSNTDPFAMPSSALESPIHAALINNIIFGHFYYYFFYYYFFISTILACLTQNPILERTNTYALVRLPKGLGSKQV
jgi:hypothetical protein